VKEELNAANAELWRISKHPLDRLIHPDVLMVTSKEGRNSFEYHSARVRCLRIVNAMARQQRWDAELLSFGLPKDCLVDPFNGRRLLLKKTPAGPIIYSVGLDLVDNGGTFENQSKTIEGIDIGLAPPKTK
jgi:hypothetical protein